MDAFSAVTRYLFTVYLDYAVLFEHHPDNLRQLNVAYVVLTFINTHLSDVQNDTMTRPNSTVGVSTVHSVEQLSVE